MIKKELSMIMMSVLSIDQFVQMHIIFVLLLAEMKGLRLYKIQC